MGFNQLIADTMNVSEHRLSLDRIISDKLYLCKSHANIYSVFVTEKSILAVYNYL